VPDLEHALDELYGAVLGDFVATRKRLAKELKDAGDHEAAAAVAAARKPTAAAWAVNQLARRRRKDVDLLLDAGHRLRKAQASVLRGGDQAEFAAARRARQSAVARLVKAVPDASAATREQVSETLRAASVSEEGRELLARGRFDKPLEESSGFDTLAALAPAKPPKRPKPAHRDDKRAQLRAELREAEQKAKRLRQDAERAEAHAREARALADAAERRVEQLRRKA
jgi:hypothetical protein